MPSCLRCALLREAVRKVFVLSGLIGPLFQFENHAVGFQSHPAVELIFCNLNAVGGAIGAEMKQLLDVALAVEQQQRDSSLQYQETCEASGGAVTSVAVGLYIGAGLLTLPKAWNGGDLFAAYGGVFGLQMVCFLGAALMTRRLDVVGFRNTVKTRFADVMEMAVD